MSYDVRIAFCERAAGGLANKRWMGESGQIARRSFVHRGAQLIHNLRMQPSVAIQVSSKASLQGKGAGVLSIDRPNISSEKAPVERACMQYVRIMLTDHSRPSDAVMDQFIQLIRNRSDTTWVHIHCKAGKGRTTSLLSMADMLHNANKVPIDSQRTASAFICVS